MPFDFKHPYLIPADHPLASMLVYRLHSEAKHQGGHITSAAIRQAGYYIFCVRWPSYSRLINNCLLCKKLIGKLASQMMSELPWDRLEDTPRFQSTAIDVFGLFYVHKGRETRHTPATIKVWVVIFVCLPSRAIHLEPLDGLDTASFINALSHFSSVRGTPRFIRSGRGTNFVVACNQLANIDICKVSNTLSDKNITWVLNPPHSSHHGGVYKRPIGSVRRIFEASLQLLGKIERPCT